VVVSVALVTGPFAARSWADVTDPVWVPPVSGQVVRPFQEPVATYGAGHRGVDFAAPSGAPVRAANDGVVSFAGTVAGTLHVVIAHDGGIRTSYSFLSRADVRVGQRVRRGQVVGAAGGSGDGHAAGVLHFGVRVGERYVDPMLLFRPRDLTQLVRLVPVDERDVSTRADPGREARALDAWLHEAGPGGDSCGEIVGEIAGGLGFGDEASTVCDVVRDVVDAGLDVLARAGVAGAALAAEIGPWVHAVVDRMEEAGEGLAAAARAVDAATAGVLATVVTSLVRLGIRYFERLTSCPQPDPVANPQGSGNLVIAVAGQGSSRRKRSDGSAAPSLAIDWGVLGYRRGEVSYFSYEEMSATYEKSATYEDLHDKARLLGEQLKAAARVQPDRRFDLVGHSQGGVVIDLFIMELYRGHESEYPPIDNVVTFASPHEGTPTAGLAAETADSFLGPTVVPRVRTKLKIPIGAPAFDQLSWRSSTMRAVWAGGGPPPRIRYLSIVGSLDPAVPSNVGDVPDTSKVVVSAGTALSPFDDHSGILDDPDALSAAQAHLSGGAPADSCGPLVDVMGTVYSAAVQVTADAVAILPESKPLVFESHPPAEGIP
jgi:hypothetical protein